MGIDSERPRLLVQRSFFSRGGMEGIIVTEDNDGIDGFDSGHAYVLMTLQFVVR